MGADAQRRAVLGEGGLELALAPESGGLAATLRAGAGYGSGAADAQIGRAVFGSLTLTIPSAEDRGVSLLRSGSRPVR
jgi:hypothetical protein